MPEPPTEGTARYRCSHQCRGGDAQPKRECACPHDRDPLLAEHGPLTVWLEEFRIQPVEDGAVKPDRQELPGPRRWKDRRQRPLTRLRRLHKARARPTLDPVNWSTRTRVVHWWVQTSKVTGRRLVAVQCGVAAPRRSSTPSSRGSAGRLLTRREWCFSSTAIPAINYSAVGVDRPQAKERYDRGGRGGCGPAAIA
jgi:hypothetical protein